MATFLIVDDSTTVQDRMKQKITALGHIALIASDGAEGIDVIQRNEAIIGVFSDINMEGMGGLEMIRKLRQQGCKLPITVMSTETKPELKKEYESANALAGVAFKAWLPKSAQEAQIDNAIKQIVQKCIELSAK